MRQLRVSERPRTLDRRILDEEERVAARPLSTPLAEARVRDRLKLSDVFDFLATPSGAPLVRALLDELAPYSLWDEGKKDLVRRSQPRARTDDAFVNDVVRYLDEHSTLRRQQLPVAVAQALTSAVDETGTIDPRRLSSHGSQDFYRRVQTAMQAMSFNPFRAEGDPWELKYLRPDADTIKALGRSVAFPTYDARMPSLQMLTDKHGGPRALEGLGIAELQHLFITTASLRAALEANGAKDVTLLGKPYSTDPRFFGKFGADQEVIGLESYWGNRPVEQTSKEWIDAAATDRLAKLFKGVDPNGSRQFILMDEGGYLTRALHRDFPQYAPLCVVVELTQSGGNVIDELAAKGELLCDAVAVWRSWFKKEYEAPAIGESILSSTEAELDSLELSLDDAPKTALLVGYGPVNVAVGEALLRRGFRKEDIFVCDPEPERAAAAKEDGFISGRLEPLLRRAKNIFSATGTRAIYPEQYPFMMNGARVINGGSGNNEASGDLPAIGEFNDAHIRRFGWLNFQGKKRKFPGNNFKSRALLVGDQEVLLVRGNYVVNMRDDLPPEFAQIPRSLMLGGTLQAARLLKERGENPKRGTVYELDDSMQKDLRSVIEEQLEQSGQSLQNPDFSKLKPW